MIVPCHSVSDRAIYAAISLNLNAIATIGTLTGMVHYTSHQVYMQESRLLTVSCCRPQCCQVLRLEAWQLVVQRSPVVDFEAVLRLIKNKQESAFKR